MYRLIAYLGILASIILGGILGLFASVLAIGVLQSLGVDFAGSDIKITTGIALGAVICGALAVIHVRRYLRERRETQLVKHLASVPENAGELIKSIIREMRYRKEVRQEVMAELAAHFEDEVRDCKSDEEKDKKAQQLIEDFGDAKLLGVLLRRAKKRCRPLWRTVVARTFQTIGILILCFIIYTAWFLTGKPTISVDYLTLLNQMGRPKISDEENAWPHYEKAIELYVEPTEVTKEFIGWVRKDAEEKVRFSNLSEDSQAQILEWVSLNEIHWNNFTSEQQAVILKCLEQNQVPIIKSAYDAPYARPEEYSCRYNSFHTVTEEILKCIKEKKPITVSVGRALADSLKVPHTELNSWIEQGRVPPNFIKAVSVALLKEWMNRYKEPKKDNVSELTDTQLEYIQPWLKQNEAAWQKFVDGSLKTYCYREYETKDEEKWLWNVLMPHLKPLRDLAKAGIWQGRMQIGQGHTQKGLENCLVIVRVGSHWQDKPSLIEQLVGLAISRLGCDEILHIAAKRNLSAIELKQLQQQLLEIYPNGPPPADIESERLMFLDMVQRLFTDGGPGGGHLVPKQFIDFERQKTGNVNYSSEFEEYMIVPYVAAGMVHARRDETIAKGNDIYDKLSEIVKISPYERQMQKISSDDIILAMPQHRYFLIHYLTPAIDRVFEVRFQRKALHEATVTVLALRRWRLERNGYPANLDELVTAGYLSELPMDPYSKQPLVYKRTDDDFVLYSVGPNFIDDGGESGKDKKGKVRLWADNGDAVFWPVRK